MFKFLIKEKAGEPLYVTLYKKIKEDIEQGRIKANEKLPSKRVLADELGISVITVQNAYGQLIAEGYIYAKERRGYYADEVATAFLKGNAKKKSAIVVVNDRETPVSFGKNETFGFPASVWAKEMRKVISDRRGNVFSKTENTGLLSLRKGISEYLYRLRGMEVGAERIVIGAGAEYLYGMLVKLIGREKIFGVENPGYKKICDIYKAEGVEVLHIPLDGDGLSVEALRKSRAQIVHISPTHNFPTGIVTPVKRRLEIIGWAQEQDGRYIIEDDYDSEFRLEGRPLPTMYSADEGERTVYINTFSKSISHGLRIGYMILPQRLMDRLNGEFGFYSCPVSVFEQHILTEFIGSGHFESHINRMRRYYRKKRNEVMELIKNGRFGETVKIKEEKAGLHFVLELSTNKNDEQLKSLAVKENLEIEFVSDYIFGANKGKQGLWVLNYSAMSVDEIKKAIEVLEKII